MRKITDEGVELYRKMVDSMLEIEHETVWFGKKNGCLIFTTINPDTATKAIEALRNAGVLCDTDLGSVGDTLFIKELAPG